MIQQDFIEDSKPGYYYFYCSVCNRWAAGAAIYYGPRSLTAIRHLEVRWKCYCGKPYPILRVMEQLHIEFP